LWYGLLGEIILSFFGNTNVAPACYENVSKESLSFDPFWVNFPTGEGGVGSTAKQDAMAFSASCFHNAFGVLGRLGFYKNHLWFVYAVILWERIGISSNEYNRHNDYEKSGSGKKRRVRGGDFSCLTGN
jgi:hypothetical protein